jgi:hypothetical protein
MTIHPNASVDECMQEIGALERELADVRSEAAAWAERAEQTHTVIEMSIKTLAQLDADNKRLRAALEEIATWSRAYPLSAFPKPDLEKARHLLESGGMRLDTISADAMRHVVKGVREITHRALEGKDCA